MHWVAMWQDRISARRLIPVLESCAVVGPNAPARTHTHPGFYTDLSRIAAIDTSLASGIALGDLMARQKLLLERIVGVVAELEKVGVANASMVVDVGALKFDPSTRRGVVTHRKLLHCSVCGVGGNGWGRG
jgi:hypothetical protein